MLLDSINFLLRCSAAYILFIRIFLLQYMEKSRKRSLNVNHVRKSKEKLLYDIAAYFVVT